MGTGRDLATFDLGHDFKCFEKARSPPQRDRVMKAKDISKRLARCGKCDNCCRRDCGTCYNCADKPKFGGAGVKKQACINRKCTVMIASFEDGSASKERFHELPARLLGNLCHIQRGRGWGRLPTCTTCVGSQEARSTLQEGLEDKEELKPVLSDALPLEAGTWCDPLELQAEFIEINERHRRESKWTTGIAAF